MKIKIPIASLIFFNCYFNADSAFALTQTTPVTAIQTASIIGSVLSGVVLTEGGVFHYDGVSTSGTVSFYFSSTSVPDYVFTAYTEFNGTTNTKTDEWSNQQKNGVKIHTVYEL